MPTNRKPTFAACFAAGIALVFSPSLQAEPDAPERWTVIHCGRLLAIPGGPVMDRATVVIRGERIERVEGGFASVDKAVPPDARANAAVVDLKDLFVLPGLIDCHVHLTMETSPDRLLKTVMDTEAETVLNGVVYARRTLEAGFTTVRDVGSRGDTCFALRDAINAGKVVGPRIVASGQSITPTGGHGDRTNAFRPDVFAVPGPIQGVADGVDACRQAVRNQVKNGADCIKLTATGGVLSAIGAGLEQQFFDDELRAIVETAHLLGKKVAAHAHGVRGINAALRAGVDSIEHGTYLDEESISLFRQTGAYYVPTITAGKSVAQYAEIPGYYIGPVVEKARTVGPVIQGAFEKAHKAGVKIAFGTDAGVFPHGDNWREFIYMAEAGMSPEQIIVSATVNAADLLGWSGDVGTVKPGKFGDLIAVAGDPLHDIALLKNPRVVIKGGTIVKERRGN